jgi:hypothetical protein
VIKAAQVTAFYRFDVSESVALDRLPALLQAATQPARLASKPAIPSYVRYSVPPLQIEGDALGVPELDGFQVRVKVFDYGVISVSLTKPFAGTWRDLTGVAHQLSVENALEAGAERVCRRIVDRVRPALDQSRDTFLSEDYFVFNISALTEPLSADQLLEQHGGAIAHVLRAETQSLAAQERDEVLRHRLSYLVKLVGDVYAARLLALAHSRLGVTSWRASVNDKLKTLDEIYRFAVDQTAMERGELLELAIVGILVFELILFFMGIMT